AITAMFTAWKRFGKPDTSMALNGALAGLVAITAGCAVVSPLSAIIIGAIAGILVVLSVEFIDKVLRIDDPVGAISVHGVCGAFGTLAVGLFAQSSYGNSSGVGDVNGLFFGGGLSLFVTQLIGVISVFVWVFGAAFVVFKIMKMTVGLRVSEEEELKGLDIGEHGMESYSGFQVFTTQ
ncbi:MAG: ammonium transporter, partial [Candidatus Omnitrophica bacterium]|nr:ammonium transporter [Candidatus Omnitrophota bacterium]